MQRLFTIHPWQWAMALAGMAAMLSAHHAWLAAYAFFKPLAMLVAMACVWCLADRQRHPHTTRWLLAGLALSLVGDVCLLTDWAFLPGLVAFLCAHLCYIALLRRDRPWTWRSWAVAACGVSAAGVTTYGYLVVQGLAPAMRLPVAAYVLVIGAMVVHALARAATLRTPGAWCVALGALSFMVSDSVLALNKFVAPVPASALWILGTYYLAQWLIVHGLLQALHRPYQNKSYSPFIYNS